MVWIYYDFYRYSGIDERTVTVFDKYLKRQDYFFVLAVLLTPDSDQTNLVGKQQSQIDLDTNTTGPYPFNEKYFKTRYGGMQYYNAGCLSMGFIIDHDPETGKSFALPRLTKGGESMALAFEKVIKNTVYYKEYRRSDKPVPKEVLKEYGVSINISLRGFDQCKALLRRTMFESKRYMKLAQSASLVKLCYEEYGIRSLSRENCRQLLFDHCTPSGIKLEIPPDLQEIANAWELVIGRQYFTSGLEMIWKYMLSRLSRPMTMDTWIKEVLTSSVFTWDTDVRVSDVIHSCHYDYQVREKMINDAARGKNEPCSVENGIRIMLSVFNWLTERTDFGEEKALLSYGLDSDSISLTEYMESMEKLRSKSVMELIIHTMKTWLVNQHYKTAFEKMLQGRDGFFYELIDEHFVKKFDFSIDFQGIRLIQLMQVMKDLDLL